MSTSKRMDKICIVAIVIALIATILYMNLDNMGISLKRTSKTMGYEDRLFSSDKVHSIDIVLDDWDSFIENCEDETYVSCTVVIDGEKISNIGIRAKGNTSLSNVSSMGSQRYSFKLEFDQYEDGKSYHGLDKLCLNNIIQDNTMMKDYLVYQMMEDFGVDSPLSSFAYITVNGEDWGLYLAVEAIEDSFLTRNYGSESGDLYKPDSLSFGGGRGNGKDFNMNDFTADQDDSSDSNDFGEFSSGDMPSGDGGDFDFGNMPSGDGNFDFGNMPSGDGGDFDFGNMPSGDGGDFDFGNMPSGDGGDFDFGNMPPGDGGDFDFGNMPSGDGGFGGMGSDDVKLKYIDDDPDSYSNIFNNAKTVVTTQDQNRLISSLKNLTDYTNLENTLDMDEVLRYFVIHNFVVNGDSYTGSMIHNYYLYEENGQLSMIPWDYNLAYGTFMAGDASGTINASIDSPVSGDVNDRPMVGWIFSSEEYTEMYHELFEEYLSEWLTNDRLTQLIEDTAEMIRPYVEKDPTKFCTLDEFDTAIETMKDFVTLRTEAVSNQLNGDNTLVEVGDLNLSELGSMGGGMGGGDFPGTPSDDSFPGGDFSGGDFSGAPSDGNFPGNPADSNTSTPTDNSSLSSDTVDSTSSATMSTPGSNDNSSSEHKRPGGDFSFGNDGFPESNDFNGNGNTVPKTIILLGISFISIIIGLIIAKKKKY